MFGANAGGKNAEDIPVTWEEIKHKEKEGKTWIESPLKEIPRELPSLTRAAKVLKKADKLYGKGSNYKESVMAIAEAAKKLEQISPEEDSGELDKIMGDFLLNLSNVARICKIPAEQVLTDRIEDMIDEWETAEKP